MRVHVIAAVLRIVLQNKDGRVVPVRAMRKCFHHPAHRQVIVRHGRLRCRQARLRPEGVVVAQAQDHELRQFGSFARRWRAFTNWSNSFRNSSTRNWSG